MESLPVPSVQAMVAVTGGDDVPPRYLRPEAAADAVTSTGEDQIPIIDHRRLLLELDRRGEESARLHSACQDWGFFQLINHSVPDDVVEGMKASIQEFFQLPAETKRRFAQQRGRLEGYGQLFVVSEDQKLDWADMLFLHTQPPESRNAELWPDQPASFRFPCGHDGEEFGVEARSYHRQMHRRTTDCQNELLPAVLSGRQSRRLVPALGRRSPHPRPPGEPCPRPADQAERELDIFEILTNGRYRSIEHRVVVDPREERLSVAAFHSPNTRATIGPLKELMARADGEDDAYETVEHGRFRELFLATKLEGKSFMERMKLK